MKITLIISVLKFKQLINLEHRDYWDVNLFLGYIATWKNLTSYFWTFSLLIHKFLRTAPQSGCLPLADEAATNTEVFISLTLERTVLKDKGLNSKDAVCTFI